MCLQHSRALDLGTQFTCFAGTHVRIQYIYILFGRVPAAQPRAGPRYSVYLLCWYTRTNTDAEGAAVLDRALRDEMLLLMDVC